MKKYTKGIIAVSIVAVIAVTLLLVNANSASAGTKIYVGQKVAAKSQVSMEQIDHSGWDTLLKKYVDQNGLVDYKAWHRSSSDRDALETYLNQLSTAGRNPSATADAQLAFWINAYNAVTVHGILREYPTSSIRNHTAKVFGYNIWKDLQLYVGSEPSSLEQIEHQILRKMGEPRIHFAIVCASIGCPRLLNQAYTAEQVQKQLETNARDFFSRPQNFRYDQQDKHFYLSSILDWFASDFGANQAEQLKTIAPWLPDESARQAAQQNAVNVSYLDYNWDLNSQKN